MKSERLLPLALIALLAGGCSELDGKRSVKASTNTAPNQAALSADDDEEDEGDEEEAVALDKVPAAAKQAALAAVPGLVLQTAELETEHGVQHYCLSGTANGESVEVEVTADGKVGEIERGEDEDEDEGDDD